MADNDSGYSGYIKVIQINRIINENLFTNIRYSNQRFIKKL